MLSKTSAKNIDQLAKLETLALTHQQQQNWNRAERLYSDLVPMLRAELGLCHERVLYAAENLANVRTFLALSTRKRKGEWLMKAIMAYEFALDVMRATDFQPGSPVLGPIYEERVSHIYWQIAELYRLWKRDSEAVKFYQRALSQELWERLPGADYFGRKHYSAPGRQNRDDHGGLRLPIWTALTRALLRMGEPQEAEKVLKQARRRIGDSYLSASLLALQEEILLELVRQSRLQQRQTERSYREQAQQAQSRRQQLQALLSCPTTPAVQQLTAADRHALLTPCSPVLLHLVAENRTLQVGLQEASVVISRADAGEGRAVEALFALRLMNTLPTPIHVMMPDRSWKLILSVTQIHYDTGHVEVSAAEGVEFSSPRTAA